MAIITPSLAISEIRGSVGDLVFSRNKYRAYTKPRTVPYNPMTSYQTNVRLVMGYAVADWEFLSDTDRILWFQLAERNQSKFRLGDQKPLSAYNLFLRFRMLTYQGLLDYSEVPVLGFEFPAVVNSIFLPTTLSWNFNPGINSGFPNFPAILFMSDAVSPGRYSPNSVSYKAVNQYNSMDADANVNVSNQWEVRYGIAIDTTAGKRVHWKLVIYDPGTGYSQTVSSGSSIVLPF